MSTAAAAATGSGPGPDPVPGPGQADVGAEQPAPLADEEVVVAPAAAAAAEAGAGAGVVTIVISQPEEAAEPKGAAAASLPHVEAGDGGAKVAAAAVKEAELARTDSFDEQCRVCQQKTEEPLVDLGCRCRGDLSKAHRTCISVWFRTRGSNKCEICQQVAVNIPPPETQASGWFSPLWVAFAILIGGLLLDVLISVSLGVSALPVNIIIGVLIVLGLGTALRLALECCQEWGSRRSMPRLPMDGSMAPSGYHPGERLLGFALGSVSMGGFVLHQRRAIYRSLADADAAAAPSPFSSYQPSETSSRRSSTELAHVWNKGVDETLGRLVAYLSSRGCGDDILINSERNPVPDSQLGYSRDLKQ
uniref:RING-CH-type domain-containing protein n=1 Tax=Oryza punctata TaxID=4537 RepID=A0A0E0M8V7_ORYPU